ncbi:unnamed protein product [Musa acuminata var. zebrina]
MICRFRCVHAKRLYHRTIPLIRVHMERMSLGIPVTFLLDKMDYQDSSHRNSVSAYKEWGLRQQTSQCCPTYMCVLLVGFVDTGSHSFSSNKIIIAGHHVI